LHRFGHPADVVRDHGKPVSGSLEVDEAKALDAAGVIDARHRKDIGAIVKGGEFVVGNIPKKTNGEIGGGGSGLANRLLVAAFALAAHDPVFEASPVGSGEQLQVNTESAITFAPGCLLQSSLVAITPSITGIEISTKKTSGV